MIERSDEATVIERTRSLYGGEGPLPMEGTLHVVAVHDAALHRRVMKIGPSTPKSETDHFVLELARARVEAVLVSGAVLRAEPELTYDPPHEFLAWRRSIGILEPLTLVVLTAGDVPLDHRALHGWARPLIVTGRESRARIARESTIEAVGLPEPSALAALEHLYSRGCRSVSIEAGPRTTVPLYDVPGAIDELMLSVFSGELDPSLAAGDFLSEDDLRARGFDRRTGSAVHEPSGDWRFERWINRARRGTAAGSGSPSRGSA